MHCNWVIMERKLFSRNVKSFFWSQISGESHADNTEAFKDCKNSLLVVSSVISRLSNLICVVYTNSKPAQPALLMERQTSRSGGTRDLPPRMNSMLYEVFQSTFPSRMAAESQTGRNHNNIIQDKARLEGQPASTGQKNRERDKSVRWREWWHFYSWHICALYICLLCHDQCA